uniref:Uncharacterized protein n=1 Tax=Meloidogyne enterolobii TaxID=390850 RepID=A0A6V7VIY3_MELEN|nr:unnamed protein product [Meloidogyne enterolobii]
MPLPQKFAIDGNSKEFFLSIAKIGQLFILLANLHVFVDAEVQSQLGVVWKAAREFWSSLEIDVSSNSQIPELSETLYLRSNELVDLLPKFVFIKSSKSQLFLLATLLHFLQFGSTTISTNKRREFLDSFAVIQGCFLLLKENGLIWKNLPYLNFNKNSRLPKFLFNNYPLKIK